MTMVVDWKMEEKNVKTFSTFNSISQVFQIFKIFKLKSSISQFKTVTSESCNTLILYNSAKSIILKIMNNM